MIHAEVEIWQFCHRTSVTLPSQVEAFPSTLTLELCLEVIKTVHTFIKHKHTTLVRSLKESMIVPL